MGSGAGKSTTFVLVILNVLLYLIVIAISGWAVNHGIERSHDTASFLFTSSPEAVNLFPIYYPFGNMATGFVVILSLIAGTVGFTTSIIGIQNIVEWDAPNLYAASASSITTWLFTLLAMGLACKEIDLGWTDDNLRALEVILILVSGTQLLCIVAIHLGLQDINKREMMQGGRV